MNEYSSYKCHRAAELRPNVYLHLKCSSVQHQFLRGLTPSKSTLGNISFYHENSTVPSKLMGEVSNRWSGCL